MRPTHSVPSSDGVTLALHDLGGDGPPVILCHPTGFLGMIWAPVATHLAGVAHAWAPDLRGHGDSTSPPSMDFDWRGMADDVLAVVDHLGLSDVCAAGHSMGGAALVLSEQRRPGTFSRLYLYEPILFPRAEGLPGSGGRNPLAEAARRRRSWFPDRQAAYDNFAAKPPLATFAPESLRAYVDHGFRDIPGGDAVELRCTPEVEALVFEQAVGPTAFDRLGQVRAPVTVAVGGDGSGPALVAPLVADALPNGHLERYPHLSHFGPMEDPAAVAAAIAAALDLG
ncbi:MAG: alpha/beta fold hydrolase [Acidimicrobiales bacterium]